MNADEVVRAIESLEYLIGGDCCDNQMDFVEEIELALAALREKAERSGCEVCNSLVAMRYETVCDWSDDGKAVWDTNNMNFCPNCGAKIESEDKDE